jgi:hypothetical protein
MFLTRIFLVYAKPTQNANFASHHQTDRSSCRGRNRLLVGIVLGRHVSTILSCPESTHSPSHTPPGGTRFRIGRQNCWQEQQPRLEAVSAALRRNRNILAVRWFAPTTPASDHNFDNGIRTTAWSTFPECFVDNRVNFRHKACQQDPPMP